LMVVVLPLPLGPSSPKHSPYSMVRHRSCTATYGAGGCSTSDADREHRPLAAADRVEILGGKVCDGAGVSGWGVGGG
jgi:hypothetical protein